MGRSVVVDLHALIATTIRKCSARAAAPLLEVGPTGKMQAAEGASGRSRGEMNAHWYFTVQQQYKTV